MNESPLYGVAVALVKDKRVFLSRRMNTVILPKKWQFINTRITGIEQSQDSAVRVVEDETGVKLSKDRLYYTSYLSLPQLKEYYYLYLVGLRADETPIEIKNNFRSSWRSFKIDDALVLDVIPGIREILKKMSVSLKAWELLKGKK